MELPILISFLAFKYPRCVNRPNTIIPAEAKESPSFHSRAIIVYPKKSKGDPAIPMFELAGGAKTPRRELFSQLWLRSKSKSACLRTWETSAEVLIVDNIERRRRRRAARTEGRNGSGVRSGTRRRRRRSVFSCVHLRRARTSWTLQRDIRVDLFLATGIACHGASSASRNADGSWIEQKKGEGAILWWEAEGEFCSLRNGRGRIEGKTRRMEERKLVTGRKNKGKKMYEDEGKSNRPKRDFKVPQISRNGLGRAENLTFGVWLSFVRGNVPTLPSA